MPVWSLFWISLLFPDVQVMQYDTREECVRFGVLIQQQSTAPVRAACIKELQV